MRHTVSSVLTILVSVAPTIAYLSFAGVCVLQTEENKGKDHLNDFSSFGTSIGLSQKLVYSFLLNVLAMALGIQKRLIIIVCVGARGVHCSSVHMTIKLQ